MRTDTRTMRISPGEPAIQGEHNADICAELGIDAAEVKDLSPIRLKPRNPKGRLIVTVGGAEGAEFQRNSAELALAWKKSGLSVTRPKSPGRYHFDVLDELTGRGRQLNAAVMGALRKGG